MKAVIFARVSTQEQETDGHSIDAQLVKMREYCKKNDLIIIKEYSIVESSTKGERPEFNKCLQFIREQKTKVAIVSDKVDRLQRSILDVPKIDQLVNANKLCLHYLDIGKLDNDSNSAQKAFYRMAVVFANAYTDAISDNVKRSILHKLNSGECIQKAPLGYLNVRGEGDKSEVIVDKARSHLIKKMFEMYSLGNTSLGDLEKFAKDNNLTNNFFSKNEAKPITSSVISCLLKNPFYYGEMYVETYKKFYKQKYEKLISKELYDACQKVTEARSKKNNRKQAKQTAKNHEKEFLFRNMIRCGTTGRVASPDKKNNRKAIHLIVWNPENQKKKVWVNEADILKEIGGVFKSMQIPKEMLEDVNEHLENSCNAEKEYHEEKMVLLRRQLKIAEGKTNKLLDSLLDEDSSVTKDMFNRKNAEIQKEIANLRTEIAMHDVADEGFKVLAITVFQVASDAYDLFEYGTLSERRSLIDFVLSDITLTGKKLGYTLRKPFDLMVNLGTCPDWLPRVDGFRTYANDIVESINRPRIFLAA